MTLSDNLISDLHETAERAADAAADVTLAYFRQPDQGLESKLAAGFDPVTLADRAAEAAIRDVIAECRPDDGILGEEHDAKKSRSGLTWVIDPIDGTRGFISGTPTWGTLISVGDHSGPILGLIDQPYIGERFIGGPGRAELLRQGAVTELSVRDIGGLSEATLFTTFPEVGSNDEAAAFRAVARKARLTRYGMDCYAYALLAAGQIDLVIEAGLQSYDVHAPIAVITAAGGIVTDWTGAPVHAGGRVLAAATPALHREAMDILSSNT